jgi:CheY-like chemotaxis protein
LTARFRVAPEAALADEPDERPAPMAGLRILLAEDEAVNQLMVKSMLEKRRHVVTTAATGADALQALEREPFDCVLMDIQMPVMDGLEAFRRIRAHSAGRFDPTVPVIALTAHAMKGDRERFLAEGMNGYLAKPVQMDDLFLEIEKAVSSRS